MSVLLLRGEVVVLLSLLLLPCPLVPREPLLVPWLLLRSKDEPVPPLTLDPDVP